MLAGFRPIYILDAFVIAVSLGYFAPRVSAYFSEQTVFDFPERNLRITYQTNETNGSVRKCGDSASYNFIVEQELSTKRILAHYIDCNANGMFKPGDKEDEYRDFYNCWRVTWRKIVMDDSLLCMEHNYPDKESLVALTLKASKGYDALLKDIEKAKSMKNSLAGL